MTLTKTMATVLVAMVLAGGIAAHAADTAPTSAPAADAWRSGKLDPDAAWQLFQQSAQERLSEVAAGPDGPKVARQVLGELEEFAHKFPATEAAAMAWYSRGLIAMDLEEFDIADASLRQAQPIAKDPKFQAQIKMAIIKANIRPGQVPPAFTATTLTGQTVTPASYHGKVFVIDFWATWCGPCVDELPNMLDVYKRYHGKGMEILSISADSDLGALTQFVKEHGIPWGQVYNHSRPVELDLSAEYGADLIPWMIVVGRDGKITAVNVRGEELEKAVKAAIDAPAPPAAPATQP